MNSRTRRVVVTGLGLVSPVGNGVTAAWEAIVQGRSGVGPITRFDASGYATRIAGEVKNFDPSRYMSPKELRRYDTFIHYGMAAAKEALADAGIDREVVARDPERFGVAIGSGIGGLPMIQETCWLVREHGPRRISPFFIPGSIINMISGLLSIEYGLQGPNLAAVTACSTANHCIGESMRAIEYGDADVMVVGGSESAVCELGIGGFNAARALSTRNDAPTAASRPWDVDRDGFVLGEGAGVLVIEELEHAKRRGARIYCELAGYGVSSDAYHVTAPCEDGDGARRCMLNALRNAGLNPDQVGYINAHGTSTPLGDVAEAIAIERAFGEHARRLMVSSTKSMTGHLLGAAAGVEAVFTVLALHHGIVPPTINLDRQDPAVSLDLVPNVAREARIDVAMSNSFGFGGTNSSLVFCRLT
ncbi:MAG: beta-ketoacyl-ACP synthase II [Casimicrobiaceae bacterium]|nr:beta-ketoacyl-ACP synthase II [Casimicrobiaceae bacterium]MCX8099508.1 beta-ketoacyl-ACP synthase II [Casimicrobiaceae bacterium]MDW8312815.1 beta-ketoacyl-ACP synthase II [Burkholderiales bacterium]